MTWSAERLAHGLRTVEGARAVLVAGIAAQLRVVPGMTDGEAHGRDTRADTLREWVVPRVEAAAAISDLVGLAFPSLDFEHDARLDRTLSAIAYACVEAWYAPRLEQRRAEDAPPVDRKRKAHAKVVKTYREAGLDAYAKEPAALLWETRPADAEAPTPLDLLRNALRDGLPDVEPAACAALVASLAADLHIADVDDEATKTARETIARGRRRAAERRRRAAKE